MIPDESNEAMARKFAIGIASTCVRDTFLEDLHAGMFPSSKTGDFSDVKVVTPYGEIPWNKVSRLSDEEMKHLMKEIVDNLYTFLLRLDGPEPLDSFGPNAASAMRKWDTPKAVDGFLGYESNNSE